MQIPTPARRERAESIVPMINVVFLLLIFFLMTAQIAPPEPFAVEPPEASRDDPAEGSGILYISAEGVVAWQDQEGAAAIAGLADMIGDMPAQIRADANVDAATVARVLSDLSGAGVGAVTLLTASP